MNFRKLFLQAAALALLASVLPGCNDENLDDLDPLKKKNEQISGTLRYSDGSAASGITVTDGYTCTQTDASGAFTLKPNASAYYIYYSIPEDAKIENGSNGLPLFFKRYDTATKVYDFTLTRQEKDGKFRFIAIGDVQPTDNNHIKRIKNETVEDIKAFLAVHKDMPSYANTLGDNVNNKWDLYPTLLPVLNSSTVGVPLFYCMGNHDHVFPSANDIAAQRTYEKYVAPANYSYNRGDVHFLVMDDIIHTAQASPNYDDGFTEAQYKWAKEELSYVDKDKAVVLVTHAGFTTAFSKDFFPGTHYFDEMLALLAQFSSAIIVSGHSHTILNDYVHQVNGKSIREYIAGAACGYHWNGTIGSDGAPNGYAIFEFDGNKLANQHFKGTKRDEGFQMRIYRATDFPKFTGTKYNFEFSWGLTNENNRAVINIWNYDTSWDVDVYENGVKTSTSSNFGQKTMRDMWAKYYFYQTCQISSDHASGGTRHIFWYTMQNPSTTDIKVVAKDSYGNVYEQSGFTLPGDDSCNAY